MIFSVEQRARSLERWLHENAYRQFGQLRHLLSTVVRQSVLLVLAAGTLCLFAPFALAMLRHRDVPSWLLLTVWIASPMLAGAGLAVLRNALLPLGRLYLADQFEGRLFMRAEGVPR